RARYQCSPNLRSNNSSKSSASCRKYCYRCGRNKMQSNPILILVGARPNFVKLAPVRQALIDAQLPVFVVHTGQHHEHRMSAAFFEVLRIPEPDVHLGIKTTSRLGQLAEIAGKLESVFLESRPRLMVVIGDVTSTLAGAVAAAS